MAFYIHCHIILNHCQQFALCRAYKNVCGAVRQQFPQIEHNTLLLPMHPIEKHVYKTYSEKQLLFQIIISLLMFYFKRFIILSKLASFHSRRFIIIIFIQLFSNSRNQKHSFLDLKKIRKCTIF